MWLIHVLHVCCHSFLERDKSYEIHFAATSKAVARTRELTAAQGKAAQPLTNLPYNGVYFAIIHEPKNMKLVFKRFYDLGAHALNVNLRQSTSHRKTHGKKRKRFKKLSIWGRLLVGTCHTRKADAMRAPRAATFRRAGAGVGNGHCPTA